MICVNAAAHDDMHRNQAHHPLALPKNLSPEEREETRNPPRASVAGLFFQDAHRIAAPEFGNYFPQDNLLDGSFDFLIAGITNGKQTSWRVVDIVQPVSSSLPKKDGFKPGKRKLRRVFFRPRAADVHRLPDLGQGLNPEGNQLLEWSAPSLSTDLSTDFVNNPLSLPMPDRILATL